MNAKLKYILPVAVGLLFVFFGYKIVTLVAHKKQVAEAIKVMPTFSYLGINGKPFSNASLQKNKPTVFFYFNSECEFCNSEAQQVKEKIKMFTTMQLVFISFEKLDKIKAFANQYKLNNYDNVFFVADTKLTFSTTFDVKSLPAIVIYNKDNHLIQKCKGQTKPEKIVDWVCRE